MLFGEKIISGVNDDEIGRLSLDIPAWSFDGDVDFELTIGTLEAIQYNFAYVIDVSGSMEDEPLAQAKAAYQSLTEDLADQFADIDDSADFAVVPFSSEATLLEQPSAAATIETVNGLTAGGATDYAKALSTAAGFFDEPEAGVANVVFFLSDGEPRYLPFGPFFDQPQPVELYEDDAAELQELAEVRAYGFPGASLEALNVVDEGGDAEILESPEDLTARFERGTFDRDDIARIDVRLGGEIVEQIPGSSERLEASPLGFRLEGSLDGLEVSYDAENEFAFDLVFDNGLPTTTISGKITTGQEEIVEQIFDDEGNLTERRTFSVTQSDYFDDEGVNETVTANSLPNVIGAGAGNNVVRGDAGNDRFIVETGVNLIYGDEGIDTAEFAGTLEEFGPIQDEGTLVRVGDDHRFVDVEFFEFTDQRVATADLSVVPLADLNAAALSVEEGDASTTTAVELVVSLSQPAPDDLTLVYEIVPQTATADDVVALEGEVVVPAGDSAGTIELGVVGDDEVEGNERFDVVVEIAGGATFADGASEATATVTIIDDEAVLGVPVTGGDPTLREPDAGVTRDATVTLTRFGDVRAAAAVAYAVSGSGAQPANADDFGGTLPSGEVTFAPGEDTTEVSLPLFGDGIVEATERFALELTTVAGNLTAPTEPIEFFIVDADPPANEAPTAEGDAYTVDEDGELVVDADAGVLADDVDPDDDELSAVLVDDVTNGILTLDANGSFTYTPDADFNGTDGFTYRASDGALESDLATVTITVEEEPNAAPAFDLDVFDFAIPEDATVGTEIGRLGASDPDGDPLTYTPATLFDGVAALAGDGTLSLAQQLDFETIAAYGPATATVSDGFLDDTVPVRLEVVDVNEAPAADADEYEVEEDGTLVVAAAAGVLEGDVDPEGADLTAVLVDDVANGTLSLDAAGGFTYTPDADFTGTDGFTYWASDGTLESAVTAVTITVTPENDAPVFEEEDYRFEVVEDAAVGTVVGRVEATDVDDGDTRGFAPAALFGGAFALDPSSGEVSVAAPLDFDAQAAYGPATVEVTDAAGARDTASVEIDVDEATLGGGIPLGVSEPGGGGLGSTTVTLARTGDVSAEVTVAYSVRGTGENPAEARDFGFALPAGEATFAAGSAIAEVEIPLVGDFVKEGPEGAELVVTKEAGAPAGTPSGTLALVLTDGPLDRDTVVTGSPEADRLVGDGAAAVYELGAGNDVVRAGGGDDVLIGGAGREMFFGGPGADLFVLDDATDPDMVYDFSSAEGDQLVVLIDALLAGGGTADLDRLRLVEAGSFTTLLADLDGTETPLASLRGDVGDLSEVIANAEDPFVV